MLTDNAHTMAEDGLAAFPAAVEKDRDDKSGQVNTGRADGIGIAEPQHQVDGFQRHGGNVGDHVLDRIAVPSDKGVAASNAMPTPTPRSRVDAVAQAELPLAM